jgi:hypothetical protein
LTFICLMSSLATHPLPTTAQDSPPPPYRIYLPVVSRQQFLPPPLIAPAEGRFQLAAQRGETDATWQQLFFAGAREADGAPDVAYRSPGPLTALTQTLTTTIPISQGQRLEIRLYADTFGSVITPHPIWYGWDAAHTREGAPAPLVVAGESPGETYWDCDNDYDHQDLRLRITFEEKN